MSWVHPQDDTRNAHPDNILIFNRQSKIYIFCDISPKSVLFMYLAKKIIPTDVWTTGRHYGYSIFHF